MATVNNTKATTHRRKFILFNRCKQFLVRIDPAPLPLSPLVLPAFGYDELVRWIWPFSMHCWFDVDDDGFHNGTVSDILLFSPSTKLVYVECLCDRKGDVTREFFVFFFVRDTMMLCTTYISVKKFKLIFNFLLFLLSLIVHVFDIVSLQINIFKFMNFHFFEFFLFFLFANLNFPKKFN